MQQHRIHLWTHLVVLCSLEEEGATAILRGQILSSKSGILWTNGKSEKRLNRDDVIDLQVVAVERGQIYNSELYDRSKRIFPVVLNSLKSSFRSSESTVVLKAA